MLGIPAHNDLVLLRLSQVLHAPVARPSAFRTLTHVVRLYLHNLRHRIVHLRRRPEEPHCARRDGDVYTCDTGEPPRALPRGQPEAGAAHAACLAWYCRPCGRSVGFAGSGNMFADVRSRMLITGTEPTMRAHQDPVVARRLAAAKGRDRRSSRLAGPLAGGLEDSAGRSSVERCRCGTQERVMDAVSLPGYNVAAAVSDRLHDVHRLHEHGMRNMVACVTRDGTTKHRDPIRDLRTLTSAYGLPASADSRARIRLRFDSEQGPSRRDHGPYVVRVPSPCRRGNAETPCSAELMTEGPL